MSAYSQEGGGARVAHAWGHFAPELLSAGILAAIALGLRPPASALALTLPIALMAFIVATWLLMRRHDRRLCEQCVASMPLNPAERAVRLKRRFWLSHFATEPRFLIPYFTLLI